MSCPSTTFAIAWTPPWGSAAAVAPSAGGQTVVQTVGDVEDGDLAVFADDTGTKVRKATAADLEAWLAWAAKHVPISGSALYQPVQYVEVEGQLYLQRDGEPVAAPWA